MSVQTTAINASINVGVVAFGCWFGWCLTAQEQILSLVLACSTAVVLSFAVVMWQPRFGKMSPDEFPSDLFQGIFGNRNSLAPVCVLGLLALVGFIATRPTAGVVAAAGLLAIPHVYLLQGSSGATSIASFGVSVLTACVIPVVWLLRKRRAHGAVVVGAAVVLSVGSVVWGLANVDRLSTALNRGNTLTGRRPIWSDVVGFIRVHPIRGYGYWAFWDRPELTHDSYIRLKSSYGSAHNSALEVMLGLGVVGLVLYLAIGLWALVGLSRLAWFQPSLRSWWWASVFAIVVVQNLTESFVLWHSYLWVLFVAAALVPFNKSDPALVRESEPVVITS
ncbi:MAG: O-antigen ligase family protein [Actinomycetia bacterium]|nr:O-antigen ligase family protein [Actinomycetes bacterium]